jgi:hypothetical protein
MVEINDNPANLQDIAPPPNPLPPPRIPHTHINPDVIQLLKELPLYGKLEKNKQLEADNIARTMRKVNHRMNPEAYPVDASDFASLVTIDEADMNQLLDDDLRIQYRPVMSIAITKWVAETQKPGLAAPALPTTEEFLAVARPPRLNYSDFSAYIISRPPFDPSLHLHDNIFSRIIHPYDPLAFQFMLDKHDLKSFYPFLIDNLLHGFPLGRMPSIPQTIIIPNNPSFLEHADTIFDYLHKEVSSGRMSGPFSQDVVERILRGPFHSSPLIVVVQPQDPGEPDKIRICRHLSKATKDHVSVNSHIAKEDFPTRFDTASKVADIVSFSHYLFLIFPFYPPYYTSSLRLVRELISSFCLGSLGICTSALPRGS